MLDEIKQRIRSALSPAATPVSQAEPVREAAQALIASRSSTYKARNGRVMGIEDDSGEMMWIVPFDEMNALDEALAKPVSEAGGEAPNGCPPVGTVCGISGANSDYATGRHYTEAKVIAYTPDGQFGWFQKEGCWPWQERLSNCQFRTREEAGNV